MKPFSRYSMAAMAAERKTRNREAQTTDDLLESLLQQRDDLGNKVAKEFINQQVAKEMNHTIESLYGFIDNLQKNNREREEREKKKRAIKPTGPLSLFKEPRTTIATTNASSHEPNASVISDPPPRIVPITPHDHRKAIKNMLAEENLKLEEERKKSTLRSAEVSLNKRRIKPRQSPASVLDNPMTAAMA